MKFFKFSPILAGNIAYFLTKFLLKTQRVKIGQHPEIRDKQQYAYGFWHDKQFAPISLMAKLGSCKHACLVSASRDGDILATWLRRIGYHVIRGSSSRKAISSVVKLLHAANAGYSVGIAADGPRGPRYQAKSGLAFLAYKAGIEIVPLGVAFSAKWLFKKAWDKYQFPMPFCKIAFYFGQPLKVEDIKDIEGINALVAKALHAADRTAKELL
ncbi:MAG: lysophospholipid acyltransferase family protein [Candidatus Berkiellales bacterium]